MECRNIPVKFLGQQVCPANGNADTGIQCRSAIDFLCGQKSRKQFRGSWDKTMQMDFLPGSQTLQVRPKGKGKGDGAKAGQAAAIELALVNIIGQHMSGRKIALNMRRPSSPNTVYAFEMRRADDASAVYSLLLSAAAAAAAAAAATPSAPTAPAPRPAAPKASSSSIGKDGAATCGASTQGGATVEAAGTDRLRDLEAELERHKALVLAADHARLVAELEVATARREAAELKADHAWLAAEMATEIAEIKTEAMDEGASLTRMLLDEVASLRKGLALIGAKLDVDGGPSANGSQYRSQHGDGQNESGLLEAAPFWEQANLIEDSTGRPRLQSRMSSARSTDRLLLLVKRMSRDSADTGIFSCAASSQSGADVDADAPPVAGVGAGTAFPPAGGSTAAMGNDSVTAPEEPLPAFHDFDVLHIDSAPAERGHAPGAAAESAPGDGSPVAVCGGGGARPLQTHVTDVTREVITELRLVNDGSGLGFGIAGGTNAPVQEGDPVIYVTNIVVDGVAHRDGRLQPGDKILGANGVSLQNATHEAAIQAMQSSADATMDLVVARLPVEDMLHVEMDCFAGGITLAGDSAGGKLAFHISKISPAAAEALDGCLRVGDRVLAINGTSTERCTLAYCNQMLDFLVDPAGPASFDVARTHEIYSVTSSFNTTQQHTTLVEDVVEIAFLRADNSLGFGIAGGVDHPVQPGDPSVYVTYVADSGAAALDNRLRVGDRLVEVNGINTLTVTHAEAVDALKQNSTGVQMLIMRNPEHAEEILEIAFEIGAGGLGFTIYGGSDQPDEPGIVVHRIHEQGSAARDGALKPGDEVLQVNGRALAAMGHDEAARYLSGITGRITLRVARLVDTKKQQQEIFVDVLLPQPSQGQGWGFSVAGGSDEPIEEGDPGIYVTEIIEGSEVHRDGQLRFCDKLVEVNGVSVLNAPHDRAIEALRASQGPVRLRVSRLPEEGEAMEDVLQIEFGVVEGQQVGIRIAGGTDDNVVAGDPAVYVSEIIDTGAAASDARLRTGDKILVCNGESLAAVTHAQAVGSFMSHPSLVKLTIARLPEQ